MDNSPQPIAGLVELIGDKKFGFLRMFRYDLPKGADDAFVSPNLVRKYNLRDGVYIEGTKKAGKDGAATLVSIEKIMGLSVEKWVKIDERKVERTEYPFQPFNFIRNKDDVAMRFTQIAAPMGKGQRALVVAPPRTGKTVLIKDMADGLAQNHPEVVVLALLVDERPEEVTDFRRTTKATVFASSNDYDDDHHVRVAVLAAEHAMRYVEMNRDVVLFIDSLTRLGRTFNLHSVGSGRILSGGLDSRALAIPRRIFGSARKVENGGSLTIIATALIETGSKMDEVILEEFKGTGNSDLVLDRNMANKRLFPAINIKKSGTRNDELLLGVNAANHSQLMRLLNQRPAMEATQALVRHIKTTTNNDELLYELTRSRV
jgi:transcription termination factor Rho